MEQIQHLNNRLIETESDNKQYISEIETLTLNLQQYENKVQMHSEQIKHKENTIEQLISKIKQTD